MQFCQHPRTLKYQQKDTHGYHRKSNIETVTDLFRRWGISHAELRQTCLDYMSEQCIFLQTRLPDIYGCVEAAAFMDLVRERGIETVDVDLFTIIAQGDHVATERIDHLKNKDGQILSSVKAVGFMQLANGKITTWRDYFDSADMVSPPTH